MLIGAFWLSHHRLFDRVHLVTGRLLVLTIAWMFTIVWLPVATAIVGLMDNDPVQKTLYIGSLFATSVMMTVLGWYTLRHPELHDMPVANLRSGILADALSTAVFVLGVEAGEELVGRHPGTGCVFVVPAEGGGWIVRRSGTLAERP